MIDWPKLLDLAPYILPSLMLLLLEWVRRRADKQKSKSEIGKNDAEASKTMVEAAQGLVGTGGVLVTQIREQYQALDVDYRKAIATLEDTNRRYLAAMEEISALSMRLSAINSRVDKLSNEILERDLQIKNLRRCLQWCLRHLRNLWNMGGPRMFMKGITLPTEREEDLWISRADDLNGDSDLFDGTTNNTEETLSE